MAGREIVAKRAIYPGGGGCGVCGADLDPTRKPEGIGLYLEGTWIAVCRGCAAKLAPELVNVLEGRPWFLDDKTALQMECGDPEQDEGALYECAACDARFLVTELGPCPDKCPTCGGTLGLVYASGTVGPSGGDPEQDNEEIPF